ncbi:MAG: hypothetical protein K2J79_03645, partial [Ruminiclostridium sp.]|nr:hypothetical protein [Ruminiclostridium sp.]
LRGDGTWQTPPDTNTTYSAATQSAAGLMSADDKKKLDGVAAGANVNTVTGIKGDSENTYRIGNVNLTAANIGAAPSSHTHSYLPLAGGAMTGSISSSLVTGTYLAGNQGIAIINSTAKASYAVLAKMNTTNGYFTLATHLTKFYLNYTAQGLVSSSTNNITKQAVLLDESGNTSFPGTVSANTFSGNATSASNSDTVDNVHISVKDEGVAGNDWFATYASTTLIKAVSPSRAKVGYANQLSTARKINGTDFNGTGDITTANWGTSRNIAIAGDAAGNANINGSTNASITIVRRGCAVGQTGNTTANPWFKFASLQTPAVNYDGHITFHVYQNYGDGSTKMGTLKAHIRTQGNNYWQASELVWENVSSGIPVSHFVLVHTANNVAPCIVELWCYCASAYAGYQFDVISEGDRYARNSRWTLYNTPAGAAGVTGGRVNQNSTLMTISNPTTGNASTATKATQDSAGQQINTTYIKGLSVNGKTITYTKGDGSTGTIPGYLVLSDTKGLYVEI